MIGITILGSTGTIGVNTLDVIGRNRDRFQVVALTANRNHQRLMEQLLEWQPRFAVMADADAAERLEAAVRAAGAQTQVLSGVQGLEQVAGSSDVDFVMAGIVGAAGLKPTLAAARAGKRVLLANKESLVMSGPLLMEAVKEAGAELLPIDSEHNAIFQCLPPGGGANLESMGVRRILLTASGGPFRDWPSSALHEVTPAQACAHPNWVMGRKISVDSATMMNKGLEVIEAAWLFDTTVDQVEVVVHPQSVIHSLVQYRDGSLLAQLGHPDMRTPIAHALAWPERMSSGVDDLDLIQIAELRFEAADPERFPCLRLGYEAARAGGTSPTVLNAANEVAVAEFLDGGIRFTDIPRIIESTLARHSPVAVDQMDTVLRADAVARAHAHEEITRLGG
ncbi:MAG: 1-deoxy-D-xylulose-5-phosphate reductoisomerase [Gammaproteobacteria bacterium]|nr:MAG: 1-deoxy-D-xylulose-5-phosphate reductoisomerase [Gammaproteobacteria bacterium]